MKKLIIRWVCLAVALCLLAFTFVQLGEWQLRRLDQRREANSISLTNRDQDPVPYTEYADSPVTDDQQWLRVELTGSYTGEQYQVRYRNQFDAPGIEVAAIFETTAGDNVIIDRGFIPREGGQPDTEVLPDPPSGEVSIVGYLKRDEQGDDTAVVPHEFKVRLINSEAIGASLGRTMFPGYVSLISSEPGNGDELIPIEPPELDEGNHFSYALQWFTFGAIAVLGIGVLIRADLVDRRKAKAKAAKKAAQQSDSTSDSATSDTPSDGQESSSITEPDDQPESADATPNGDLASTDSSEPESDRGSDS